MRSAFITLLMFSGIAAGQQPHDHSQHAPPVSTAPQDDSISAHIAPDPPGHLMEPMSNAQMSDIMAMDDAARFGTVVFDRMEWREGSDAIGWEGGAQYGGDDNKAMIKTEGESIDGNVTHARAEALWDHVIARWWNLQTGVRHDSGTGPSRTWAAIGFEGLAPYWFAVDAAFYVGDQGRTALRAESSYDLRLTQRLVLQPQLEVNFYGKDDPDRGIGSGLSDLEAGIRLRYEIRREIAPYIGVHWRQLFGDTADFAAASGGHSSESQFIAGVRVWF